VHYGGNSSTVTYSEGDARPAAGNELYATAQLAYSTGYKMTTYKMTGHAQDAAKNGYFNAAMAEAEGALKQHNHAVEELLISQLESAIDSSGSYAGLTRSTYKMASYEAAIGGSLAISNLDTMYETLQAVEIGANLEQHVILAPTSTIGEYNDVAAGTGAGDPLILSNTEGETLDGGRFKFVQKYNGNPFVRIEGMTAGGLLYVDPNQVKRVVQRPVQVDVIAKVDDSQEYMITSSEIIAVHNPRVCGKLTT
jgi:hypothetical protein